MKLTFVRYLKLNKNIHKSEDYHAETKYTFNIGLRKLIAYSVDDEPIYILKQTNWIQNYYMDSFVLDFANRLISSI